MLIKIRIVVSRGNKTSTFRWTLESPLPAWRPGTEQDDASMGSPRSPQPTVGIIYISDAESMDEEKGGWTSPAISESQVGSPPESPEYTGISTDEELVETISGMTEV